MSERYYLKCPYCGHEPKDAQGALMSGHECYVCKRVLGGLGAVIKKDKNGEYKTKEAQGW